MREGNGIESGAAFDRGAKDRLCRAAFPAISQRYCRAHPLAQLCRGISVLLLWPDIPERGVTDTGLRNGISFPDCSFVDFSASEEKKGFRGVVYIEEY
ncbi:hypothetical protein [Rhizobium sp. NRK18]|uniref:hypothetical protein n=1 Tax=Rhizobium sp. NRK18 TaxID=2964667 RepID=UPI0021C34753|nr:hypothetical protein [Rhizobium sp. NRK18]MCQ2003036.1 hypothetical protein [Rhizobium sp. NRK18]